MADADAAILERLLGKLRDAGIAFTMTHHRPVFTSAEAAEVRGTTLHSGAKALVVKAGEQFVMVVMPADTSLDSVALRRLLGCKRTRFANREELLELTGLEPGSVPPFGSLFDLPTICDPDLGDNESINFNAGSHTNSIQMTYADYQTFESPRVAPVTKGR